MCNGSLPGSEARTACEASAKASFIARTPDYPARLERIVKWVNLNQTLADANYPTGTKITFFMSSGTTKFDNLCQRMKNAYLIGSGNIPTIDGCSKTLNSNDMPSANKRFQNRLLDGKLPNNDDLPGVVQGSHFISNYYDFFNDSGHYDHFHMEIK